MTQIGYSIGSASDMHRNYRRAQHANAHTATRDRNTRELIHVIRNDGKKMTKLPDHRGAGVVGDRGRVELTDQAVLVQRREHPRDLNCREIAVKLP